MTGKKVCMFVYNNCKSDARVLKEAKTLTDAGHKVRIFAILDDLTIPHEIRDGFEIIRVVKNPIHYRVFKVMRSMLEIFTWPFFQLYQLCIKLFFPFLFGLPLGFVKSDKKEIFIDRLQGVYKDPNPKIVVSFVFSFIKSFPLIAIFLCWLYIPFMAVAALLGFAAFLLIAPFKVLYFYVRKALMRHHRALCFKDFYNRTLTLVKKKPAAIYHGHDLHGLPAAVYAAEATGGKVVYDSHELYTEISAFEEKEKNKLIQQEKKLLEKTNAVITVNDSIAKELSDRYNIATPTVVMNCPEAPEKTTLSKENILKKAAGIPNNELVVLYQGGYAPNRGLDNLIKSVKYIEKGVMVFMGWGKIEPELKKLAVIENVQDRVVFIPPASPTELLDYTQGADVGLIPYRFIGLNNYYTSPNKLFEYIHANVPIAGSDFPELKKVIEGYEIGETFDPESPKDIAKAVNSILANQEKLNIMKDNTKKAALVYNWKNESEKLLNLYMRLFEN